MTKLRSQFLDVLDGTGVWYSYLARCDFVVVGLILLLLAWLATLLGIVFGWIRTPDDSKDDSRSSALGSLFIVAVFAWIVGGGIIINRTGGGCFRGVPSSSAKAGSETNWPKILVGSIDLVRCLTCRRNAPDPFDSMSCGLLQRRPLC